jgi:hypothetical protein
MAILLSWRSRFVRRGKWFAWSKRLRIVCIGPVRIQYGVH